MWLTKQLSAGSGVKLRSGYVESGGGFAVQAESKHEEPQQILPYGFSSAAAQGSQAVMLDGYCAGVPRAPDGTLREGEVRLFSSGGAEILLDQEGRVVINGQVFQPKEAE